MKFGIALGRLNPAFWVEATMEAERFGFDSVWMPEHLVFPVAMSGSPPGGDHPPVPPRTPVFDAFAYLSYLAGKTSRIRLATHVYNLALRHPFVAARAITTLDVVSAGRAIAGVGAGWLESEWRAAGLEFRTRGRRLDEALTICERLWTEEFVEHHGEFFDFDAVAFEPKPVQKPHPPLVVGGMSDAALQRAARYGDGWVAMGATPERTAAAAGKLRELRAAAGREDLPFEITAGATPANQDEVVVWEDAGAGRLIVAPWARSATAIDGLRRFIDLVAR